MASDVTPLEYLRTHEEAFKNTNRLASLYSSFHTQRTNNPEGYEANSQAWLSALADLTRHGVFATPNSTHSVLTLPTPTTLAREFESAKFGRPLALSAVLSDAIASGALVPLASFLSAEHSIYHKPWLTLPTPKSALLWSLTTLGLPSFGLSANDLNSQLVVRSALEAAAANLAVLLSKRGTGLTERILPRTEFESLYSSLLGSDAAPLSSADWPVLLTFLNRDRPLLSFSSTTIKLAPPNTTPEPITAQDESIANLKDLISKLNTQVTILQDKLSTLDTEARASVAARQPQKAKLLLRQKRAASDMLDARSATLATLETTWSSIERAADNVEIVKAMREGGAVLRSLNAEVGGAEGAEDVMADLRVQMDEAQDVTAAINEGSADAVDEGEVEEELEALERGEREKVERAEQVAREEKERQEEESIRERLAGVHVPEQDPERQGEKEAAS